MTRMLRTFVTASALIIAGLIPAPTFAQKSGGVLKVHHQDSPASMSIIEEATYSTVVPMMGVFNNLVMYSTDLRKFPDMSVPLCRATVR
jgi:peptide/nickel transport system substrate-binding protein